MTSEHQHTILVVEENKQIKQSIVDILKEEALDTLFCDTGESALEEIKNAEQPFSLIISAQTLDGMKGTAFLEQAKALAPDSILFLMAMFSETETLINAINESCVQRFFVKPFEDTDFLNAVQSGIQLYHAFIEHEKLVRLAKHQNSQLYELTCQLVETTKGNTKAVQKLDREIETYKKQILAFSSQPRKPAETIFNAISSHVAPGKKKDAQKIKALFSRTVSNIYHEFAEQSQRNGFEMLLISQNPKSSQETGDNR